LKRRNEMAEEMASLKINNDIILPVIEKQIQAAIVANLGNHEELIGKMVSLALHAKVNDKGYIDTQYSSYNKYDFLEVLTSTAIQEAARNALTDWLHVNSQKIRSALFAELAKPTRQKSMAKAFADADETSITSKWHMNCTVNFKEDRD